MAIKIISSFYLGVLIRNRKKFLKEQKIKRKDCHIYFFQEWGDQSKPIYQAIIEWRKK